MKTVLLISSLPEKKNKLLPGIISYPESLNTI